MSHTIKVLKLFSFVKTVLLTLHVSKENVFYHDTNIDKSNLYNRHEFVFLLSVCVSVCVCVQTQSPMFKEYIANVIKNAKAMAAALLSKGYTLVSGNLAYF